MATLSRAFHGAELNGEGMYPGSGGNLNSVYAGDGGLNPQSEDSGYSFGKFPAGNLPVGQETQEFRISDSTAFDSLRGIARTKYPFQPYPATDAPNVTGEKTSALSDRFQQTDLAGVSSLLPGKYSYNNMQGTLGKDILNEFDAGISTYNTLQSGVGAYENDLVNWDAPSGGDINQGIHPLSIVDQHKTAFTHPAELDVPLTPFHKTYPNFGNGRVDYGFEEPGANEQERAIIEAYNAVLPEGQLAGTKTELMPVFSGINQEAVEQRPILQSLGKIKNTLWLGGVTELPDELKIDPRQPLTAGSNAPADLIQTAGELASALDVLTYQGSNGLHTGNPYGQHLPMTRTLAGNEPRFDPNFYSQYAVASIEPNVFGSDNIRSDIHASSSFDHSMFNQ